MTRETVTVIALLLCRARNGTIGRNGAMPWRMPSDLRVFRATSLGKPVIMGRKTFESIGKALDGRLNIVISRQPDFAAPGTTRAASLDEALAMARATGAPEIIIAGGGEIFRAAMPLADRIYMTELDADIDGDTVFATPDPAVWRHVSRRHLDTTPKDDHGADVIVLERRLASA